MISRSSSAACTVWGVAIALLCSCVVAPASLAADDEAWLTGPELRRKLESAESMAWSSRPLRDALGELSRVHRIAVLIDRRVDPSQPLDLSRQQTPLLDCLEAVAKDRQLGLSQFGPVVVFGPKTATNRLRTLAELRRGLLNQLTQTALARWTRTRLWQWEALSTPRELLEEIAAEGQFKIDNLAAIPHDLWAAGDLPPLTIADRLTLVLFQFDLTFDLVNSQGDIRLVPIPAELAVERSYPAGRQAQQRADEIQQRLPSAQVRVEGSKVIVAALVEQHEQLADGGTEAAPPADAPSMKNLDTVRLTLTVKQIPLAKVLDKLEQQLGLTISFAPQKLSAAGRSLDERVSFELDAATLDDALRTALAPAGLTFRRRGKQVEILPLDP